MERRDSQKGFDSSLELSSERGKKSLRHKKSRILGLLHSPASLVPRGTLKEIENRAKAQ